METANKEDAEKHITKINELPLGIDHPVFDFYSNDGFADKIRRSAQFYGFFVFSRTDGQYGTEYSGGFLDHCKTGTTFGTGSWWRDQFLFQRPGIEGRG